MGRKKGRSYMPASEFGQLRRRLGLTPLELALKLGISYVTAWRYENGLHPIPETIARKLRALDASAALESIPEASRPVRMWRILFAAETLPESMVLREQLPVGMTSPPATRTFAAVEDGALPLDHESARREGLTVAISVLPDETTGRLGALCRRPAFVAALTLLVLLIFTGCLKAHETVFRGSGGTPGGKQADGETQDYLRLPDRIHTNGVAEGGGGAGPASKRSIPMPKKPFSWQKLAPCDVAQGEIDKEGGCWQRLEDPRPPCPRYSVESEGRCFIAIPAPPKDPNTVNPK